MSSSAPGDHRTMIGLPATYRAGQPRPQLPPEDEYSAYLAQMRASGLPSSTMPSAAHSSAGGRSLDQHPSAPTLDNGNGRFGVFEPQGPARSYSSFAPLLDPGQQQQVPGEFVPGGGGGVYRSRVGARPHPHVQTQSIDVSRSSTTMSGYSDPSSSANLSPVRQGAPNAPFAQQFASPPDYANPGFTFPAPTNHPLEYPSSGSDPFPPSDQYTSPSPGKYMSSPEQLQIGHNIPPQHRPMFGTTSPPFASPTRPGPAPYAGNTGGEAWLPATGLAPSSIVPISGNASSGGSSGGGGAGPAKAYSGSSGGYSAGSNPNAPRPSAGGTVGRSRSTGGGSGGNTTRYQHTHSQSAGLLAPPQAHKRQRRTLDEEDESESDEEAAGHGHGGGQTQTVKRL